MKDKLDKKDMKQSKVIKFDKVDKDTNKQTGHYVLTVKFLKGFSSHLDEDLEKKKKEVKLDKEKVLSIQKITVDSLGHLRMKFS